MNYEDNSQCQSTWPFSVHHNAIDEQPMLFRHFHYGNELDACPIDAVPYDPFENPSWHQPAWQASPSASPTSSNSTISSGPEEPIGNPTFPMQSMPPSNRATRYTPSSPLRPHSRYPRPCIPKPEAPMVHETFEVETGEEEVIRMYIHRFTDEEKRNLNFSTSTPRPTFCCKIQGCGRWILHRTQVKLHLSEHGYRFGKPYKCACGAEFGRQVEAARHVEDKKPCDNCHRSGRKYKGGAVCLRCLRRLSGK